MAWSDEYWQCKHKTWDLFKIDLIMTRTRFGMRNQKPILQAAKLVLQAWCLQSSSASRIAYLCQYHFLPVSCFGCAQICDMFLCLLVISSSSSLFICFTVNLFNFSQNLCTFPPLIPACCFSKDAFLLYLARLLLPCNHISILLAWFVPPFNLWFTERKDHCWCVKSLFHVVSFYITEHKGWEDCLSQKYLQTVVFIHVCNLPWGQLNGNRCASRSNYGVSQSRAISLLGVSYLHSQRLASLTIVD